jgi:hypothetical protein
MKYGKICYFQQVVVAKFGEGHVRDLGFSLPQSSNIALPLRRAKTICYCLATRIREIESILLRHQLCLTNQLT